MLNLEEITAACEAATPGPWEKVDGACYAEIHGFSEDPMHPVALVDDSSNAKFIAESRQWVPELVDMVQALLSELNGHCWACANHKPYRPELQGGSLTLVACEHLAEHGILATQRRMGCPHWQWRGATDECSKCRNSGIEKVCKSGNHRCPHYKG